MRNFDERRSAVAYFMAKGMSEREANAAFEGVPHEAEPLDLDAIEERVKSATEGPWMTVNRFYIEAPGVERDVTQTAEWESSGIEREEDAEFIAHARTDIPALIAEVRQLRARLDEGPCWCPDCITEEGA